MGIKSTLKTFFLLDDEEKAYQEEQEQEQLEETTPVKSQNSSSPKQNVVSLQSIQKSSNSKVILVEPRVYDEAQEIADHIRNRKAVVVNLQRVQHDQAMRIIDFLSGTVYALGGDIKRIGVNIFLCTPETVEVSGNISGFIQSDEFKDARW